MVFPAIACNLDPDLIQTALPLFETEKVAALEWSFDAVFSSEPLPNWFHELIQVYSKGERLIGHGVFFSLFSGKWLPEQSEWLQNLKRYCQIYQFDHITEHFGFMTGADFHKGAPLSIPYNQSTLAIGRDRLLRISQACNCPVGLENLAFSYSLDEVKRHGAFLNELLEPVNGFIILDLHNVFCQLHNFDLDAKDLRALYPLERVREIHISGGSWEFTRIQPEKPVRRDTHDDSVPEAVFDLLKDVLPCCPNLKYVVMEQLGTALHTQAQRDAYRADFYTMERILTQAQPEIPAKNNFVPPVLPPLGNPIEDLALFEQQRILSNILENALDYQGALNQSLLANSDWDIEHWNPAMLETAVAIARKWKNGW